MRVPNDRRRRSRRGQPPRVEALEALIKLSGVGPYSMNALPAIASWHAAGPMAGGGLTASSSSSGEAGPSGSIMPMASLNLPTAVRFIPLGNGINSGSAKDAGQSYRISRQSTNDGLWQGMDDGAPGYSMMQSRALATDASSYPASAGAGQAPSSLKLMVLATAGSPQPVWLLNPEPTPISTPTVNSAAAAAIRIASTPPGDNATSVLMRSRRIDSGLGLADEPGPPDSIKGRILAQPDRDLPGGPGFFLPNPQLPRPEWSDPNFGMIRARLSPGGLFQDGLGPFGHPLPAGAGSVASLVGNGGITESRDPNTSHLIAIQANGAIASGVLARLNAPNAVPVAKQAAPGRGEETVVAAGGNSAQARPAATEAGGQEDHADAPQVSRGLGELLFLDPARLGTLADRLLSSLQSYSDAICEASEQTPAVVSSPAPWLLVVLASVLVHEEARRQRRNRKLAVKHATNPEPIPNWLP